MDEQQQVAEQAIDVSLYLDDAAEPFARYRPPATVRLDTSTLTDGEHVLTIRARGSVGSVGVRTIPFVVKNGPGIALTGLRANQRVSGLLDLNVDAFSASQPFDPARAESSGQIPVWTWIMSALIAAWALWYAIAELATPASFAATPTYESHPFAAAAPLQAHAPPAYSGRGAVAGFDYADIGLQQYTANCSACHGAGGAGVPGAFPSLAGDAVVTAKDPSGHIAVMLKGLAGKVIGGKHYASPMPAFSQLSDQDIAAIIDHERTSWGNSAPIITPDAVKRAR